MKVETLQPIALHFHKLVHDVMGTNLDDIPGRIWNLDYKLDYDKVLDYIMHRQSNLTHLEISGLFMLEIPLDIIDVWIQFVLIICDCPSMVKPPTAQTINEQLDVVQRTVEIMRKMVLTAKTILSCSSSNHKNILSIYRDDIITDIRSIIDPFLHAHKIIIDEFLTAPIFWITLNILDSFSDIHLFIRATFIDDAIERLGIETNREDRAP